MNNNEFLGHIDRLYTRCKDVLKVKNTDYGGPNVGNDPFNNFRNVERFNITDTKTALLVRLSDKFSRIANLSKNTAKVQTESMLDTIEDAINYLAILHAWETSRTSSSDKSL